MDTDGSPAPATTGPAWTRTALIAAGVALAVGAWLLLDAAGAPMPSLRRHWPAFVIIGGLASLVDYLLVSRRPTACGFAVFEVGLGIFLYLFTLQQVDWTEIRRWGPVLLLTVGLAFLASWGAGGMKSAGQLTVGLVCSSLAVFVWGAVWIRREVVWGVLLLAVGAFLVGRVIAARRRG